MDNNDNSRTRPNFASSMRLSADPQPYNEWLSPSASDWLAFELNDTAASTPLSSPITPFNSSRNCFDDSFQTAFSMDDRFNQTYDDFVAGTMAYQLDASQTWGDQKETQQRSLSYGPQLVFEDNRTFGNFVPSHGIDSTALPPLTLQPEILTGHSHENGGSGPELRQESRRNSTKRLSTRKTKDGTGRGGLARKEQRRGSSGQSSSSQRPHQLRSTKNTQKASNVKLKSTSPTEAPVNSQTSNTGRASHNFVEKQYRNRLNDQFNTLLSSIPSEVIKQEITGYVREEGPERRVSKAEVLVLAKKHIETLEREKQCLEEEREGLKGTVKKLKGAWSHSGGGYCHEP